MLAKVKVAKDSAWAISNTKEVHGVAKDDVFQRYSILYVLPYGSDGCLGAALKPCSIS
jgi:hypothetical protein